MTERPSVVALIPARSGSKRLAHKNVRPLGEHPVIAYTIAAAVASKVFDAVIVSTDSEAYADIARHYGAETPFLRPAEASGDRSPDIDWVSLTIDRLDASGRRYDAFSLLRPTSPFRKPETIQRAWRQFLAAEGADSLRAVEPVEQHPGKMWVVRGHWMTAAVAALARGDPLAQPADGGATARARAECEPRDRVDARGARGTDDRRHGADRIPDPGRRGP